MKMKVPSLSDRVLCHDTEPRSVRRFTISYKETD